MSRDRDVGLSRERRDHLASTSPPGREEGISSPRRGQGPTVYFSDDIFDGRDPDGPFQAKETAKVLAYERFWHEAAGQRPRDAARRVGCQVLPLPERIRRGFSQLFAPPPDSAKVMGDEVIDWVSEDPRRALRVFQEVLKGTFPRPAENLIAVGLVLEGVKKGMAKAARQALTAELESLDFLQGIDLTDNRPPDREEGERREQGWEESLVRDFFRGDISESDIRNLRRNALKLVAAVGSSVERKNQLNGHLAQLRPNLIFSAEERARFVNLPPQEKADLIAKKKREREKNWLLPILTEALSRFTTGEQAEKIAEKLVSRQPEIKAKLRGLSSSRELSAFIQRLISVPPEQRVDFLLTQAEKEGEEGRLARRILAELQIKVAGSPVIQPWITAWRDCIGTLPSLPQGKDLATGKIRWRRGGRQRFLRSLPPYEDSSSTVQASKEGEKGKKKPKKLAPPRPISFVFGLFDNLGDVRVPARNVFGRETVEALLSFTLNSPGSWAKFLQPTDFGVPAAGPPSPFWTSSPSGSGRPHSSEQAANLILTALLDEFTGTDEYPGQPNIFAVLINPQPAIRSREVAEGCFFPPIGGENIAQALAQIDGGWKEADIFAFLAAVSDGPGRNVLRAGLAGELGRHKVVCPDAAVTDWSQAVAESVRQFEIGVSWGIVAVIEARRNDFRDGGPSADYFRTALEIVLREFPSWLKVQFDQSQDLQYQQGALVPFWLKKLASVASPEEAVWLVRGVNEALKRCPEHPEAAFLLKDVYQQAGERAKADACAYRQFTREIFGVVRRIRMEIFRRIVDDVNRQLQSGRAEAEQAEKRGWAELLVSLGDFLAVLPPKIDWYLGEETLIFDSETRAANLPARVFVDWLLGISEEGEKRVLLPQAKGFGFEPYDHPLDRQTAALAVLYELLQDGAGYRRNVRAIYSGQRLIADQQTKMGEELGRQTDLLPYSVVQEVNTAIGEAQRDLGEQRNRDRLAHLIMDAISTTVQPFCAQNNVFLSVSLPRPENLVSGNLPFTIGPREPPIPSSQLKKVADLLGREPRELLPYFVPPEGGKEKEYHKDLWSLKLLAELAKDDLL